LCAYQERSSQLNEQLANKAYELTKNIKLADDATAQAARNLYPSQQGMHPFVALCDTVGSDNFFAGTHEADTMDHIVRVRSNGAATKCTSEFEDPGFANALRLHGKLDRLIIVRTASDFETPAPGQTTVELLNFGFPGYAISTENEYRVGSKIAHEYNALHEVLRSIDYQVRRQQPQVQVSMPPSNLWMPPTYPGMPPTNL
jgi:purine nucleoside permease